MVKLNQKRVGAKSRAEARAADAQFNFAFEAMRQGMSIEEAEAAVGSLERQLEQARQAQSVRPDNVCSGVI